MKQKGKNKKCKEMKCPWCIKNKCKTPWKECKWKCIKA